MIASLFILSLALCSVGGFNRAIHSQKKFSYGLEAEKLCKAYRKVCPASKTCAIQHLVWPRKMSFPVCVRQKRISLKSKVCELPPAPGRCGARFRRWYFNVHAGKCSWFTFGGCDGNLNNFRSEEECNSVCLPKNAPNIPTLTADAIKTVPAPPRAEENSEPALLSHPAPVPLQMKKADLRQALQLKEGTEESLGEQLEKTMKLKKRRRHRKGKGRKGRKGRRRRGRKHRGVIGPYAELKVRKTSYRPEKAQSDQGNEQLLKTKRRLRRKLRLLNDRYYDKISLFRILATQDNPLGISVGSESDAE